MPRTANAKNGNIVLMARRVTLGQFLQQQRERLELKQEVVARLAGISQNYLSALERDLPVEPSPLKLLRISKALRVNPAYKIFAYLDEDFDPNEDTLAINLHYLTEEDIEKITQYVDDLREARIAKNMPKEIKAETQAAIDRAIKRLNENPPPPPPKGDKKGK